MTRYQSAAIAFLLGIIMHVASNEVPGQGFRLVLLPPKYKTSRLDKIDLKKLKPGTAPLLDESNVLRYDVEYHRLVLDYYAGERLRKMKIPKSGLPFAVFAGNDAIYTGALFDGYTMETFRGVAVDVRPLNQYPPSLLFELDYPPLAPKNPANDPRGDERLIKAFERAQKLYREVWLDGVVTSARATGKRRMSYVFDFSIEKAAKGVFAEKTLAFELYADEQVNKLFDLVEKKQTTDGPTRFRLKFQRQVREKNPYMWFQSYEVLD